MFDTLDVLIADDHPLFRQALMEIVGQICRCHHCLEACSLGEALELGRLHPQLDFILLDLMMPGMDGFSGLVALRREIPDVPVVIVSANTDRATVFEAISHGAVGFITKTSPRSVMVKALLQVKAGDIYVPSDVMKPYEAGHPLGSEHAAGLLRNVMTTLTRKQLLVLERLALGESNKQIARALSLAEPTVKAHVSAILRKLDLRSRANVIVASRGIDFRNLHAAADDDEASSSHEGSH